MATNEEIIKKYDIRTNHSQQFFELLDTLLNDARQDEIEKLDTLIDNNKFDIFDRNLSVVRADDIHSKSLECEICNKPIQIGDIVTISDYSGLRIHKKCKQK